jgi:hypothetical protein
MLTLVPITVTACVLMAAACTPLSSEDRSRLEGLRSKYGGRYDFSASDLYLSVRAKEAAATTREDWVSIYRDFWFAGGEHRSTSALVYMNVYDVQGVWQGQFYWNPNMGEIAFSHAQEHY